MFFKSASYQPHCSLDSTLRAVFFNSLAQTPSHQMEQLEYNL